NDKQESMSKVLMNVGLAKVSTNAYEAKRYGYLRDTDSIIFNKEKRVEVALNKERYESETNYITKPKAQYTALGKDFKALAQGQLDAQRLGHFISDYDYEITMKAAHLLPCVYLTRNSVIILRYFQKLEGV